MKTRLVARILIPFIVVSAAFLWSTARAEECPDFLDHDFRKLHSSETINLCRQFAGKPLLIVNTASHCGFTPQFKGLESLHRKYEDKGLVVLGFPSNDFRQEADNEEKTAQVCYINYGVTFLFRELANQSSQPNWNFNKYLVSPSGKVVKHFDTGTTPESSPVIRSIESLL